MNGTPYLAAAVPGSSTPSTSFILKWTGSSFSVSQNLSLEANDIEFCNIPNAYVNHVLTQNWLFVVGNSAGSFVGWTYYAANSSGFFVSSNLNINPTRQAYAVSCFTYNQNYYAAIALDSLGGMVVYQFVNNSASIANAWVSVPGMNISGSLWSIIPISMQVATLNNDLTAIVANDNSPSNSHIFRWTGSSWIDNGQTNIPTANEVIFFQLNSFYYAVFGSYTGNANGALWRYNPYIKEFDMICSMPSNVHAYASISGQNWIVGGQTTQTLTQYLLF